MIDLDADLIQNSLQWRDACQFVASLGWGDLAGETLMDLGCGTGQTSTRILLDTFPGLLWIIATDGSAPMIRMAKEVSPSPKVSYYVVDIQDEKVTSKWFNTMKNIISIHSFHWLQNHAQAFRNIYEILRPGGRAAILFVLNAPNFDANGRIWDKWKGWLSEVCPTPVSQVKQYGESDYLKLLQSIGFEVDVCKAEKKVFFTYESNEKFQHSLLSVCPLVKHIPDPLKDEFSKDLLKDMLECCKTLPDGRPEFWCTNIKLMLRKKSKP